MPTCITGLTAKPVPLTTAPISPIPQGIELDPTDPRASEPLVDLQAYGIEGENFYGRSDGGNSPYHCRVKGAITVLKARRGVAERLALVNQRLARSDLKLWVFDAYRPLATQWGLWHFHRTALKERAPEWDAARLDAETKRYVADPRGLSSTNMIPPPHNTGGAVDLTLIRISGEPLDFGTAFDDFTPQAETSWFEHALVREKIPPDHPPLIHRRNLYWTMCEAGFTNYHAEWWHYDYGNALFIATRQRHAGSSSLLSDNNPPCRVWYGAVAAP